MGIGIEIVDLLSSLRKDGYLPTPSRVIEIGAQQLANSLLAARSSVEALGLQFRAKGQFPPDSAQETQTVHGDLEALSPQGPSAGKLCEWLGFHYSAIDIDGSQRSIPLDLNCDDVPAHERGKFCALAKRNGYKLVHQNMSVGLAQLPPDIIDSAAPFESDIGPRDHRVSDCGVRCPCRTNRRADRVDHQPFQR